MFKRYSLAIRQETAPVEEVLAVLDATRRQVEAAGRSTGRAARRRRDAPDQLAADPPVAGPQPVADPPADADFAP